MTDPLLTFKHVWDFSMLSLFSGVSPDKSLEVRASRVHWLAEVLCVAKLVLLCPVQRWRVWHTHQCIRIYTLLICFPEIQPLAGVPLCSFTAKMSLSYSVFLQAWCFPGGRISWQIASAEMILLLLEASQLLKSCLPFENTAFWEGTFQSSIWGWSCLPPTALNRKQLAIPRYMSSKIYPLIWNTLKGSINDQTLI